MSHVYCPECGYNNPESAHFCAKCGASLIVPEEGEQTETFAMGVSGDSLDTLDDLGLQGVVLEENDRLFPEMRPLLDSCRFPDCAHVTEPDCAVRAAVESGEISRDRYASYVSLRQGRDDDL